jgi:hypothetical protein
MLILRKKTIFNLILTAVLLSATAVWAETVEYDGLIEPYVVVDIGAPAEGVVATVSVDRSTGPGGDGFLRGAGDPGKSRSNGDI